MSELSYSGVGTSALQQTTASNTVLTQGTPGQHSGNALAERLRKNVRKEQGEPESDVRPKKRQKTFSGNEWAGRLRSHAKAQMEVGTAGSSRNSSPLPSLTPSPEPDNSSPLPSLTPSPEPDVAMVEATANPRADIATSTRNSSPLPSLTPSPEPDIAMAEKLARSRLTVIAGVNTKPRLERLSTLPGYDFFNEVAELYDLFRFPQKNIADSVDLTEIIPVFLKDFENKAVEYALNYPKSDLKDFNKPIELLRKFTPAIRDVDSIKRCDEALNNLIQKIPQYARPVPKRAFCIWEGKEISQKNLQNMAKFLKLNPDYSLTLITSDPKKVVDALMKRHDGQWLTNRLKIESPDYSGYPLLESAINQENVGPFANHAAAADLVRMFALVKKDEAGNNGGLYFDVDCEFHKPLPKINAPFGLQTFWPPGYFLNGIMAAAPGCDILENVIQRTLRSYDDRKKGFTWSADLWVNKRAGVILPKDDKNLDSTESKDGGKGKGKSRKPQAENSAERLIKEIDHAEKTGYQPWANVLRQERQEMLENPRQGLTEKFTIEPLWAFLRSDFSYLCSNYSKTLNVFSELAGPDKVFELPYEKGWADRSNFASKRRASIA